jgi:hypothetical protein
MNVITELLDDAGFVAELRRRRTPLSLRDAAARLGIELTDPSLWAGPPGEDFEPAGPELLERAQLARFPASALPEVGGGEPLPDLDHGAPLWLEARYLDEDRREITVFPNEEDRTRQRVMLYAPGELRGDSVILDVVSGELQVLGRRRRLSGLFKRHPACPTGSTQADGTFHCPPGTCPKGGTCTQRKRVTASGVKLSCRCRH